MKTKLTIYEVKFRFGPLAALMYLENLYANSSHQVPHPRSK